MKGFEDTRGTLFFNIAQILEEKRPKGFVLENVKQLVGHNKGKTLKVIMKTLKGLGYYVQYAVLNALDYGLPQKRERIIIVGHIEPILFTFPAPKKPFKPLREIIEKKVDKKHYASDYIRKKGNPHTDLLTNYPFGMRIGRVIFVVIHIHVLYGQGPPIIIYWSMGSVV